MANFPPYNPYQQMMPGAQQIGAQQMMPQMPQQMPVMPQMQQGGLSSMSRPVSGKEEAMAAAADFSGAMMLFPDIAHGRVYLKRWNMQTGAADFLEFAPVVEQRPAQPEYVSVQSFQMELEKLRAEIASMKGGVVNAE